MYNAYDERYLLKFWTVRTPTPLVDRWAAAVRHFFMQWEPQ